MSCSAEVWSVAFGGGLAGLAERRANQGVRPLSCYLFTRLVVVVAVVAQVDKHGEEDAVKGLCAQHHWAAAARRRWEMWSNFANSEEMAPAQAVAFLGLLGPAICSAC